jgi:hypothetical protein
MTDAGFDEWLSAVGDGEGYFLECPAGHGSLPPRRTCPHCGATDLEETSLPETGTVDTYTEIHVAAPDFVDETPYVTAVATFGPVRLTGVLRDGGDVDPSVGMPVEAGATENQATGESMLVFDPR